MKYAEKISEMMNAFSPEPLQNHQMDEFYCGDTMEYRTSDKYVSPIEDIFDACQMPSSQNAFLLLGHKGCGKSTELNKMSSRLYEQGYRVKTIYCSKDLDLFNLMYTDLFILMGEALVSIAEEIQCPVREEILLEMDNFWSERTEITASQELSATSIEAGFAGKTPNILSGLIEAFARIKADLKYNEETRKEYRKKISVRSSEWIRLLNLIADQITEKLEGNQPILIFEDLDKLDPEVAWKVFYHYAATLSGVSFPVIYTFPIGLSYDPRFSALEGYFRWKTLPMIKIETITGEVYQEGVCVIQKIVEKRARLELFETDVLEVMIRSTGGSLRDLFYLINTAATRAHRRGSATISEEDARRAIEELKTSLTRRIDESDYPFLR